LKHKNYPCPAPLRNRHGRYVGLHNTKPYVLFEFLEGHHVQHPNEQQKQQLIQKAAELHTLTRKYRPTHKAERWNYSVELCQALAEKAALRIDTVSAREKLAWHRRELAQLQLPSSLPKGICHADFHFSNVLFQGDTVTALLDFDDANYTFLLFDLVGLIESSAWPYDTGVLNFAKARQVVSAYTTYRPLNHTEKRHLFDVYKLSVLIDCVWYFARGEFPDFYEKRKIDHLNGVGRAQFYEELFGD
jgi:Ser/Thr protein kinase RdoA (MazF antagonist)